MSKSAGEGETPRPGAKIAVCGASEMPRTDGTCLAVGATKIPSAPVCPLGSMAIPGDMACRAVSVCKPGRWPEGLPDTGVVYVDAGYTGVEDGGRERPFRSITSGLAAGSFVVVAEGRYTENLTITKPSKIVGACTTAVEIVGTGTYTIDASSDLELRDVTVRGSGVGVGIIHGKVTLDRVWIHDTGDRGIDLEDFDGPAELAIRDSLIERTHDIAVFSSGATLTIERSVLRGTRLMSGGKWAQGIQARGGITSVVPTTLTLRQSIVEDMIVFGIEVNDSNATFEDSIIRQTHATAISPSAGLTTQKVEGRARLKIAITRMLIEDHEGVGADCANAIATIDGLTIHGIGPNKSAGLLLDGSEANIAHLTVYDVAGAGVSARGSKISLASAHVHDIRQGTDGTNGVGLIIESRDGVRGEGQLSDLLIERATGAGFLLFGSIAEAHDVAILSTQRYTAGSHGDAASVLSIFYESGAIDAAELKLTRAILADNSRLGLGVFGATAHIGDSILCNPVDLDVEHAVTFKDGSVTERAVVLEDAGNNVCGCATAVACTARTSGLSPVPR